MIQTLRQEPTFSALFLKYVLSHSLRIEEDLVDQLFNSSEKRLARVLLLLANFGKKDKPHRTLPHVNQAMLARDDWHHTASRQFLYEQVQEIGFCGLQWSLTGAQFSPQYRSA